MSPRPRIAALLALLHAQREEVDRRATLIRESDEWLESSAQLDEINVQIMHLAEFGAPRREAIGHGHELELDSRPEGDLAFRRFVVDSLRAAVTLFTNERLIGQTNSPLSSVDGRIERAKRLLDEAENAIRSRYPDATITGTSAGATDGVGADLYTVEARREGKVA